jgi:hypothetical protein
MKNNDINFDLSNQSYKVPADINVAILHTVIAVTALRDVMIKENEALERSSTRAFMDLQEEKVDAARRYELLVTTLMDRAAELKTADEKMKDQLQRLQGSFGDVAAKNKENIERMRNATQLLGDRIMKSARDEAERMNQFAYGASGKMQRGTKALMGLDERA